MIEVVFDGRPIPWARPGKRGTRRYTPTRQDVHREALAKAMQFAPGVYAIEGPASMAVTFDYGNLVTRIAMDQLPDEYGRAWTNKGPGGSRADVDNLLKQAMEAAELAGIVGNDVQFVVTEAVKLG